VLGFSGCRGYEVLGRLRFILTRREPSGGRSHASEPVSAQESSWPQKGHVVTRRHVTVHILFKIPNAQLLL
jgi:hypothetical protein